MGSITFKIIPPPTELADAVECFRVASYKNGQDVTLRVCPNGHPGIVFQSKDGKSAVRSITTNNGQLQNVPTLFLHGQVTTISTMHFTVPYTSIQAVLRPYAASALFNLDASSITDNALGAADFGGATLNRQLISADTDQERIQLLSSFLAKKWQSAVTRDYLVEKAIALIDQHIDTVAVEWLILRIGLSERQFERRFLRSVGITPQLYIRIRRVNAALKLMDTGSFERLADIAHALNYHDQSHFIRDIKTFAGITPKSIVQKVNDLHRDEAGLSYTYGLSI